MGRKSKRRAKKKKRTLLPPKMDGGAKAPSLATLAAEVAPSPPVAAAAASPPVVEEHRASTRVSLSVELHLASESHFFSGLSGDISEGGVFVSTYRQLAQGSPVDLEFSLPGSERVLHARGTVRWHRDLSPDAPPGVGIAFEDLGDEDRAMIHRFCTMRPPLYYDDVG